MVAQWTGLSGGAYGDAWQQWHRGAGEAEKALSMMQDALKSLHAAGGHAHGNYTQAAHTNRGM